MMRLTYPFTTDEKPKLAQVGGKAMSLILMTREGLPVPPGFVLTVDFFEPWLAYVRSTTEWMRALESSPEDRKQSCDALVAVAGDLELDDVQRATLAQALESLSAEEEAPLFAVRSSSPEEDLEELSFAGGYETVLGVKEAGLEEALKRSFASCFAARVFAYKEEHGLPVENARIAVIVQVQIAAQTAGVGFSLNPINNCYDEAVINANFGLGESVVSGMVSPDSFTVDKVSRTILERKTGKKETSVWLQTDLDGGTYEEPSPFRSRVCLTDEEVLELTDMLVKVEEYYQKPVDIEWAFAGRDLYLLQARPITGYFPVPESMLTAPGAPKLLYNDVTLTKWGMQELLSVMGTDYMTLTNAVTLRLTMSSNLSDDAIRQMRFVHEGRTYSNLSNTIKMEGKKRFVSAFRTLDPLSAEAVASIDDEEYVAKKLPPSMRGILLKAIGQNLGTVWAALAAVRRPAEYREKYLQWQGEVKEQLKAEDAKELSLRQYAEGTVGAMIDATIFFSVIVAAQIARSKINGLFKDEPQEIRDQIVYLERALPDNVTIEMGLAMYDLSRFEEVHQCSAAAFASRITERSFSPQFLQAWDSFMEAYGFRSPMEMDPAAPRFYDQPELFFGQLKAMSDNRDPEHSPQAIFDRAREQREEAYRTLLQVALKKGKRKAKQFESSYNVLTILGGYREHPKYLFVMITDLFRRKVLGVARTLVDAGRLDYPEQAFDLTMDDLDRGIANPSIDLRALAESNTEYIKRLRHVREFPRLFDSRGRILRAPRKEAKEGELVGEPISPGVVRGKVKVLHTPDEKPVEVGEILVARATDPGWTPLFLNAAGIILEVGGLLQHGALVAREYGKPCVSGIEQATEILEDGQVVELDGTNGVVRCL